MYLKISQEVKKAIDNNIGVVAVESALLANGVPYPKNVQMLREIEQTARDNGCIPATVAVIDGVLTVGCSEAEIDLLGKDVTHFTSISTSELPLVIAQKGSGVVNLAIVERACQQAGISVIATDGIGKLQLTTYYSKELTEDVKGLKDTNVAVVCLGAKSNANIAMTYFQKNGVSVVGYQTDKMGFAQNMSRVNRLDSVTQIAEAFSAGRQLGLNSGMLVVNALPEQPQFFGFTALQTTLSIAIGEAESRMYNHPVKPEQYVPARVNERFKGRALEPYTNVICHNVRVACEIAQELCRLKK